MNEIKIFDNQQIDTIKNMYCKGLNDEEITVFMHICQRTKLDPFAKQIYAVPRWDSKLGKNVMSVQTGIDGYRLIAERTGKYSPGRESTFIYDPNGRIISATAYVKKMTDDKTWHEVAATAFFDEYCQRNKEGKPTQFWMKMGHTMISKCAEALALRKAFPGDLSGLYTQEEMQQANVEITELEPKEEEIKQISVKPALQLESKSQENKPQKERNTGDLINQSQIKILGDLADQCDPDYMAKCYSYLQSLGILDFSKVRTSLYPSIEIGMRKNAEITRKKS